MAAREGNVIGRWHTRIKPDLTQLACFLLGASSCANVLVSTLYLARLKAAIVPDSVVQSVLSVVAEIRPFLHTIAIALVLVGLILLLMKVRRGLFIWAALLSGLNITIAWVLLRLLSMVIIEWAGPKLQ